MEVPVVGVVKRMRWILIDPFVSVSLAYHVDLHITVSHPSVIHHLYNIVS